MRGKTEIGIQDKIAREIDNQIAEIKGSPELNVDKLAILVKKDWPDEVFKSTELKRGRVTHEPPNNTKVILVSECETDNLKKGDGPNWIDKLTGMYGLLEKNSSRKNIPFMCEKLSTLSTLDEDAQEPEKSIILAMMTDNSNVGIVSQFKAFRSLENRISKNSTVNIAPIGDVNVGLTRKVVECALRDPGLKLVVNSMALKRPSDTIIVKSTQVG